MTTPIDQDSGLRSLILSFEAAPDLNTGWIIPAIRKAIRRRKKYDFIISTAPPWSSHIAAIYIGRRLKAPVILDNRDPWIGNSFRLSFITHPLVRRLDKYLANRCYSRAAGIVCVTEAACRLQESQINNNSALIEYIPHGYDPIFDKYYSVNARSKKLTITHVGSTYHGRSPGIIVEAATKLDEDKAKDFHFRFIGETYQPEVEAIEAMDKKFSVTFHGFQNHEYCVEAIKESDVCLLMAIGQPAQIPSKLYEYIGMGRPILAISDEEDSTMNLLKGKEWAWGVAHDDQKGLIRVLKDIHHRWKNDCLPILALKGEREEYGFERIADEYIVFIKKIIGLNKRGKNKK